MLFLLPTIKYQALKFYILGDTVVKRPRREGIIDQFLWSNRLRNWSSKSSNLGAVEVVEHLKMLGEPLFAGE